MVTTREVYYPRGVCRHANHAFYNHCAGYINITMQITLSILCLNITITAEDAHKAHAHMHIRTHAHTHTQTQTQVQCWRSDYHALTFTYTLTGTHTHTHVCKHKELETVSETVSERVSERVSKTVLKRPTHKDLASSLDVWFAWHLLYACIRTHRHTNVHTCTRTPAPTVCIHTNVQLAYYKTHTHTHTQTHIHTQKHIHIITSTSDSQVIVTGHTYIKPAYLCTKWRVSLSFSPSLHAQMGAATPTFAGFKAFMDASCIMQPSDWKTWCPRPLCIHSRHLPQWQKTWEKDRKLCMASESLLFKCNTCIASFMSG